MPPEMFQRTLPEYVAGIVLYLCSEECAATGEIFNAASGFFSRAAILTGPGTLIGGGEEVPSPEDIRDQFKRIDSMGGARELADANTAIMSFLTPPAVQPAPAAGPPAAAGKSADAGAAGGMDVKGIFARMPGAFRADKAAGVNVLFQFAISGPGGGDWNVAIKDGTCTIAEGKAEKPTTTIKMADADFLALIAGKLDGMQAYSSGKLKVEGDIMKSQLIGKLFKFEG
jgi:putative sterol carrier protein